VKIIETQWNSYLTNVVPPEASESQVSETRRAFYAGAASLFHALVGTMDDDEEPTERDLERVSSIHKELEDHMQEAIREAFGP
jgi:hypothetical protein